mmetsp:Transcript_52671/g.114908  ORF Transcript_52671/g.114908 Transcript_52671/m.114908 type:complete len:167 (+) Transcript_52671:340-840(+)|eukprot:1369339-Pleurochrysis_carterae.AAC.4
MCIPFPGPDGILLFKITILQLITECIVLVMSLFTVIDYGFFGLVAAILGLVGVSVSIARGCGSPTRAAYTVVGCNSVAVLLSLVHIAFTIVMIVDAAGDSEDKTGEITLLSVLCGFWVLAVVVRITILMLLRNMWKRVPNVYALQTNAVAHGVPVVEASHTANITG